MGLEPLLDRFVRAALRMAVRGPRGDLRRFLGGVLWILRTGAPWRDLPSTFGAWNSVFHRFRRWVASGRWAQLLTRLRRKEYTDDVVLIDSTVVHAHPDAAGARSQDQDGKALGGSRGGFTTKVHALVSSRGRWLSFCLTPGQRADITQAIGLLETTQGARAVVGDRVLYAFRNVVERFFGRLKRFRRVGTRYDRTTGSFGAFVALGATIVERTAWK